MARKLARLRDDQREASPGETRGKVDDKFLLNRREYVRLGAAATATVLGTGAGMAAASDDGEAASFTTDFSEYAP
jgi:hypothetical protein